MWSPSVLSVVPWRALPIDWRALPSVAASTGKSFAVSPPGSLPLALGRLWSTLAGMATPALTVHGIEIPWESQTLDGFRTWVATFDERGPRVSFARGRVHVDMGPQSYDTHEPLVGALNAALRTLARELDLGRYFLPPSWFTHEATGLSTEPDGFLALWSSLEGKGLEINPDRRTEMVGHPDMVLEVVSDTSRRKDLVEHVTDYALAGVREYWIADARQECVVFRILRLEADAAYAEISPDGEGWISSPVWQRSFRVRRLPERAGLSDFALDIRP